MSQGPCGLEGRACCAAGAAVAVANVTPAGRSAIAAAAARVLRRAGRMGSLSMSDGLLSFICWLSRAWLGRDAADRRPFRANRMSVSGDGQGVSDPGERLDRDERSGPRRRWPVRWNEDSLLQGTGVN